jgi:hypothetical protein
MSNPVSNVLLDSISSLFNGSRVTFPLRLSATPFNPVSAAQLMVVMGGVPQTPVSSFTIQNDTIIFTAAPATGLSCFIVAMFGGNNTLVSNSSLGFGLLRAELGDFEEDPTADDLVTFGNKFNYNMSLIDPALQVTISLQSNVMALAARGLIVGQAFGGDY